MQLEKQIIWDAEQKASKVLEVILCLEYAREDTECTVGTKWVRGGDGWYVN